MTRWRERQRVWIINVCLIPKDEKWNKLIFYNQLLLLSSSVEQGVSQSSKPVMSGKIRRKTGFKKE